MEFCKFEEGKAYGNWNSSLKRRVIKRTPCYVTFEGGMRKKIETKKLDPWTMTETVKPHVGGLNVYAACER